MRHNHALFIDLAIRTAKESRAVRLQTGAVIARDTEIISLGYNGTPPGWETNVCEIDDGNGGLRTNEEIVIHAEMNAVLKAARDGKSTKGAILYATHAPCAFCAKHIIPIGITAVYYRAVYRLETGLDIMRKAGIECVHVTDELRQQWSALPGEQVGFSF